MIVSIISYALAGALLVSFMLLAGFFAFLREVFAALILPFAVLIGMAGWQDRQGALSSLRSGLAPEAPPSAWLFVPVLAGCLGLVAVPNQTGMVRRAALFLPIAAVPGPLALHAGWLAILLLPGAIAALVAWRKGS